MDSRGAVGERDPDRRHAAASWLRPLFAALSPAGPRARLTILIFHRVHATPDDVFPNEMHAVAFRERMVWIRSWFNVLPLEEALVLRRRGTLSERALAITFDDGYADNVTVALPILRQLQLPATFFVATDFLDGGRMWNDTIIETVRGANGTNLDLSHVELGSHAIGSPQERKTAIDVILGRLKYRAPGERQSLVDAIAARSGVRLSDDLMMTSEQVRDLAAGGMGIGGHTRSHPILARLDEATSRREIADGRDVLEEIVGQPVRLFAYPNGKPNVDYNAAHVRMVKALGFVAAVSTAAGAAGANESPFELPRFTPWGSTRSRWSLGLIRNLFRRVGAAGA